MQLDAPRAPPPSAGMLYRASTSSTPYCAQKVLDKCVPDQAAHTLTLNSTDTPLIFFTMACGLQQLGLFVPLAKKHGFWLSDRLAPVLPSGSFAPTASCPGSINVHVLGLAAPTAPAAGQWF